MIRDYGISERTTSETSVELATESLKSLGYAIVDSGYSGDELSNFAKAFDAAREKSEEQYGQEFLRSIDEENTIRALFHHDNSFLQLAMNQTILSIVSKLLGDYHVLSQQNGIINPPQNKQYNQGAWHRDLPYQHVVFSRPMAINGLFCIDDFTHENGATLVLPASHKQEEFPSDGFIKTNHIQVVAPAGSFIVLDCMCYHSGASNNTQLPRRAVNHVYTVPIIRQQIDIPDLLGDDFTDDPQLRRFLGYDVQVPSNLEQFYKRRPRKKSADA
ncbi:MAG: phytanoyl-CoA dioxygenase family protein [Rhizobiaceae bacterium]